jgi:peptide/nickel transport system ATP-binding protein
MYKGKIVEKDTTDNIFNNPSHPYTQKLLSQQTLYN